MEQIKLNETPVRTSRNFNINNIKLQDVKLPENVSEFKNVLIKNDTSKIVVTDDVNNNFKLTYGLNDSLESQIKNNQYNNYKIQIDSKVKKEIEIDFTFNNQNMELVDNIEILANEESKATVIIKYAAECNLDYYHNGIIRVFANKNSNIEIIVVNLLNEKSNNFISIENELEDSANVKYTCVDFGGKNSITNYYSNLQGNDSNNELNTIYLGKQDQLFDLNYIGELRGEKTNLNIEVQGALKDNSRKHFKGTIDFKKGSKKATGNENEFCMLLSDKARSLALPMLLCSEEDVEGNHSTSSGKVGEKELFYIMSRGFDYKAAMKLLVRANFNKILENIKNESLKNEILYEIDNRLD